MGCYNINITYFFIHSSGKYNKSVKSQNVLDFRTSLNFFFSYLRGRRKNCPQHFARKSETKNYWYEKYIFICQKFMWYIYLYLFSCSLYFEGQIFRIRDTAFRSIARTITKVPILVGTVRLP